MQIGLFFPFEREKRNYFHLTHRVREDDYNYTVTAKHSETIYDFKVQSRLKRISMRPKFFWIMRHTDSLICVCVYLSVCVCDCEHRTETPQRKFNENAKWKRKLGEHSLAEIDLRIRAAIKSHNKREIWCEGSLLCQFNWKKKCSIRMLCICTQADTMRYCFAIAFFRDKKETTNTCEIKIEAIGHPIRTSSH